MCENRFNEHQVVLFEDDSDDCVFSEYSILRYQNFVKSLSLSFTSVRLL